MQTIFELIGNEYLKTDKVTPEEVTKFVDFCHQYMTTNPPASFRYLSPGFGLVFRDTSVAALTTESSGHNENMADKYAVPVTKMNSGTNLNPYDSSVQPVTGVN